MLGGTLEEAAATAIKEIASSSTIPDETEKVAEPITRAKTSKRPRGGSENTRHSKRLMRTGSDGIFTKSSYNWERLDAYVITQRNKAITELTNASTSKINTFISKGRLEKSLRSKEFRIKGNAKSTLNYRIQMLIKHRLGFIVNIS